MEFTISPLKTIWTASTNGNHFTSRSASSSWASGLPMSDSTVARKTRTLSSLKPGAVSRSTSTRQSFAEKAYLFPQFACRGHVRRLITEIKQPGRQLPEPSAQRLSVLMSTMSSSSRRLPGQPPRRSSRRLPSSQCYRRAFAPHRNAARKVFDVNGFGCDRLEIGQPRGSVFCSWASRSTCPTSSGMLRPVRVLGDVHAGLLLRLVSQRRADECGERDEGYRVGLLFSSGCAWVPTMNGWTSPEYSMNSTR